MYVANTSKKEVALEFDGDFQNLESNSEHSTSRTFPDREDREELRPETHEESADSRNVDANFTEEKPKEDDETNSSDNLFGSTPEQRHGREKRKKRSFIKPRRIGDIEALMENVARFNRDHERYFENTQIDKKSKTPPKMNLFNESTIIDDSPKSPDVFYRVKEMEITPMDQKIISSTLNAPVALKKGRWNKRQKGERAKRILKTW